MARQATTSETITQELVMFKPSRRDRAASEKRTVLRGIIDREGEACTNAIIFCNRKTDVDITAKSLKKYGYNAEPIHGDLDQSKRMEVLQGFRDGTIRFLCASDVAARGGLDIPNVSHVFNFDVPGHAEDYVHRIGRTGRAGRDGKAVMICEPRDEKNLDAVERLIETEIPRVDNPVKPAERKRAKPEDTSDEKPARGRGRGRKSGGEKPAPPAQEAAPPQEAKQEPKRDEPRVQEQKQPARGRGGAQRGRGGKSGGKQGGNTVPGMGDHVPDFIAKSFEERRAG